MLIDIAKDAPPVNQLYRLITSCAVPRPIALVATRSPQGTHNVAPFSYFNFVSTVPLMLMFAPILDGKGRDKDTLSNIAATREFVVAAVTEAIVERVNQASANYPPEVDEFQETGLTPGKATQVNAPLVLDSPINFECKLFDLIRLGKGPYAGNIVLGEVCAIHIDDKILTEKQLVDPAKLKAVGRMGQGTYVRTGDRFDLVRPILPETD